MLSMRLAAAMAVLLLCLGCVGDPGPVTSERSQTIGSTPRPGDAGSSETPVASASSAVGESFVGPECEPGPGRRVRQLEDVAILEQVVPEVEADGATLLAGGVVAAQVVDAGCVIRYAAPGGCLGAVEITAAEIPAASIPGASAAAGPSFPAVTAPAAGRPGAFAPQVCQLERNGELTTVSRRGIVREGFSRSGVARPGGSIEGTVVPTVRLAPVRLPAVDVEPERLRSRPLPRQADVEVMTGDGRTSFVASGQVLFSTESSVVRPQAEAALAAIAERIRRLDPGAPILVEGHTDDRGSDAYGLALSRDRARAVAAWLVANGFAKGRISERGHGERRPAVPNDSAANRALNRRVVITVLTGDSPTEKGSGSGTPTPSSAPSATSSGGAGTQASREITVSTSRQLRRALRRARPGDQITLADGVYTTDGDESPIPIGDKRYYGTFVLARSGTKGAPIVIRGTRDAFIDGAPEDDGLSSQYGLYLVQADHVHITGLTVRNVSKGIVLDESDHVRLKDLTVEDTGQEGIHLRAQSSRNVVRSSTVRRTGLENPTFGEGLYVGSAVSNWGTYTGGRPDRSNRNRLIDNVITQTGAESIDIKEGTTAGLVQGNTFDGAGMTGSWADSWIDVKGNDWLIVGNHGTNALEDGFQVHGVAEGWGHGNLFSDNIAEVRGPGYGFWVQNNVRRNKIRCDNRVLAAEAGFSNVMTC